MKTLSRYMAREMIYPFGVSLMVFTFILIMDKIFTLTDLILQYGVSALVVLKLLLYILPATFAITVPMACLVAVIVSFSRLKSDNELTAIRASGISLLPLVLVALVFGGVLTATMVWFNNHVLPQANFAYKSLYYDIVSQRAAIVIREHVFVDDFDGFIFRVGESDPVSGELRDIIVFAEEKNQPESVRTILAHRGRLISDRQSRRVMLRLEEGFMQMVQPDNPQAFARIDFDTNLLDLDIHQSLANQQLEAERSPREMSMGEIRAELARGPEAGGNPNLLRVEYQKKISIPFACMAFILIGAPLGILSPRSGKLLAYFLGVILIFLYYIFLSVGETLGVDGRMQPDLAMWLPNLLLAGVGLYGLFWVWLDHPPWPAWLRPRRSRRRTA